VSLLLEKGANTEAKGEVRQFYLLLYVNRDYYSDYYKSTLLIEAFSRQTDALCVSQNEWTALHYVTDEGDTAIVSLLIEKGADIEAKDWVL
jgi:ankyrin repeat protein